MGRSFAMRPWSFKPLKMATVEFHSSFSLDFRSEKLDPDFLWYNPPAQFKTRQNGQTGLQVIPMGKTDFWRRTYYNPEIVKDNGHFLNLVVHQSNCVIETSFELTPAHQFDQAGIMVRMDSDHWVKLGLEYLDGKCNMSCVVTNTYSDWSKFPWQDNKIALRVHKMHDDYVVECQSRDCGEDKWQFMRIFHLSSIGHPTRIGLYTCAPTKDGGSVVFDKFILRDSNGLFHHKAQ